MSLYDPPSFSISEYTPCTCDTPLIEDGIIRHINICAKIDESNPLQEKGRKAVERNMIFWFGIKRQNYY